MSTENTAIAVTQPRILTVNLPSKESIEKRASALVAAADGLIIDSDGMAEIAAEELREVKTAYKKMEELRKQHVAPLNEETKFINDFFRQALTLLEKAEASYKTKMLAYQTEQARIRQEEQARLETAARQERERLAAVQAELDRVEREAAKKLEAEQQEAQRREQEAKAQADAKERQAQEAIAAGDRQRAAILQREQLEAERRAAVERERIAHAKQQVESSAAASEQQKAASEAALAVMTAPVVAEAPKLAGIATKGTYKGKCTDLLALVQFIARHPEHVNLVKANDSAINQLAKAQRQACKVDGLLVWEEKSLAARSA